ncbi:DNA modification methylase [Weeksella virosa]|uniref:DNA modification methylase n=1 Tax=Weeksella virosa TaxID=1014 RepID=UPI0025537674|nr:DNA modification methylase [Weeksella virosa]MDK7376010.1 DNA modification methylase [Weeksella virosa]
MSKKLLSPLEWYTEKRKVSELVPYEFNPRSITEEKLQKLKESLEKFNLVEIPAINLDNTIIAGHQRICALFTIGRGDELIDVRVPNRQLTESELKEYNLRSNINVGEWDIEMLTEHFSEFNFDDLGLNLDDFDLPDDVLDSPEQEQEFDVELPPEPKTKPGDIYEFISKQKNITHRLICGDSTKSETYKALLQDSKFNLIVTDPPYNVDYQGATKDKLKIENDSMSDSDFKTFLYLFYQEAFIHSAEGCPIYVWHADSEGANFRSSLKDAGWKLAQCLIWVKNSLVMGRQDYHWKHEPCLYGWKEGAAHNWYSDRKQTTVLEFDRPNRNAEHPTMKPLELFSYQIKNSSKQRDIVGDSFSGSGTTLIACEQTWRQARVIELDPKYCDVNVTRWIKYMQDNNLDFEIKLNGKTLDYKSFLS